MSEQTLYLVAQERTNGQLGEVFLSSFKQEEEAKQKIDQIVKTLGHVQAAQELFAYHATPSSFTAQELLDMRHEERTDGMEARYLLVQPLRDTVLLTECTGLDDVTATLHIIGEEEGHHTMEKISVYLVKDFPIGIA